MPTTTAVFKQLKTPISSLVSSYQKAFQSVSNPGATERYALSSVTNLHPTHRVESYESNSEETNDLQNSWTGPENPRSEWGLDYETDSPFMCEDARIRKTTDIKVTRQPHA